MLTFATSFERWEVEVEKMRGGLSENDKTVLRQFGSKVYRYERMFSVRGIVFGLEDAANMIPLVGPLINIYWSIRLSLLVMSLENGLPWILQIIFMLNIMLGIIFTCIPVLGLILTNIIKPHLRNYKLLSEHFERRERHDIKTKSDHTSIIFEKSSRANGKRILDPKRTDPQVKQLLLGSSSSASSLNSSPTSHMSLHTIQVPLTTVYLPSSLDSLQKNSYQAVSIDKSTDNQNHIKLIG